MEVNECFVTMSKGCIKISDGSQRTGVFRPTTIIPGYSVCNVNDTPNLGRYVWSLEAVLPPSTTDNIIHSRVYN